MTAHEEQDQRVVLTHDILRIGCENDLFIGWPLGDDDGLAAAARARAAQLVSEPAHRDLDEPAARVVGEAFDGPLAKRRDERFLHGVFRRGKIPAAPDDGAEHLRREIAQPALGVVIECRARHMSEGGALITCRTSIGMFSGTPPLPGAAEASAAIANARSVLSQSTIQ